MARPKIPALRNKILDQAMEILEREGLEKITMRSLAGRNGHSPGAIYLRFPSKDALKAALRERGFEALFAAMEPALGNPEPCSGLRQLMCAYLDFARSRPQLYRLMLGELEEDLPAETWGRLLQPLREVLRLGHESARFRSGDLDAEAHACWAMLHGLASLTSKRQTGDLGAPMASLCEAVIATRVASLLPLRPHRLVEGREHSPPPARRRRRVHPEEAMGLA